LLLAVAAIMAVGISILSAYVNRPDRSNSYLYVRSAEQSRSGQSNIRPTSEAQQIVTENIQGELRKGSFETVVQSLRSLVYSQNGSIPVLNMGFDNDVWSGSMNCKVPTKNVAVFTFGARQLIVDNGRVTNIDINVVEQTVSQTGQPETPMSEITIGLRESLEGYCSYSESAGNSC
jgi:hypothetical protein